MSVFFNTVQIRNFKSLKDATLLDCKRINVLIGKPNVGKSNILEAIGLFSLPYVKYNKNKKITQFVRLENIAEMCFYGDTSTNSSVIADDNSRCLISYLDNDTANIWIDLFKNHVNPYRENMSFLERIDAENEKEQHNLFVDSKKNISIENKKPRSLYPKSKVKFFKFPQIFSFKEQSTATRNYLLPPGGINLFDVVQQNKFKQELIAIFHEYSLKLLFDKTDNSLRIFKELGNDSIASLPFSSMADTLQRIVFFKAAISSNTDSILLFEEPEAHCFPPYIAHITQEVIAAESNQFFIATHSPYVLNDFLERGRDELAVFMIDYQNGQTVINRLSDAELEEVHEYGIDVFFNYERYTQHG